ncbi:hypothetical protein MJH12_09310 [bacterium]|nr:hypothetical protein [bacterium]
MKLLFFLYFSLVLNLFCLDNLQEYKNSFYDNVKKSKMKVSTVSKRAKPPQAELEDSDELDFSFMEEEKKPVKSTRKRRLKRFTLKKAIEKKDDKKSSTQVKLSIDPLELQCHMILSQAKMHNNTSAINLLLELRDNNLHSAIPEKAIALYYLQKKQVQQAISYLNNAIHHKKPSNEASMILLKLYHKTKQKDLLKKLYYSLLNQEDYPHKEKIQKLYKNRF